MTKHKHTDKSRNSIPQVTVEELASTISSSHSNNQRIIVAIAGPPGSGKSTTADLLCKALEKQYCLTAQVVPMDGFHYDNAILQQVGLSHKKGSPQTFDVGGLAGSFLSCKKATSYR